MNCDFPVMIDQKKLIIFFIAFIISMWILALTWSNPPMWGDWLLSQRVSAMSKTMVTLHRTYKFCFFTHFCTNKFKTILPRKFSTWAIREQNFRLCWILCITLPNAVCSEVVVSVVATTSPPPHTHITLTLPVLGSAAHAEWPGG